jgi:hypothetical protein
MSGRRAFAAAVLRSGRAAGGGEGGARRAAAKQQQSKSFGSTSNGSVGIRGGSSRNVVNAPEVFSMLRFSMAVVVAWLQQLWRLMDLPLITLPLISPGLEVSAKLPQSLELW